ncbi:MAG: hypothetical protein ACRDLR_01135 [Gaiellaceae bacterium]
MADAPSLPLNQAADLLGEWWLPKDEDHRATGRLIFDPDPAEGLTLDVVSAMPLFRRGSEIPIVLGLTVDGHKVTLRDVFQRHSRWHSAGGTHTVASPSAAFVGIHIPTVEELRFDSIEARLSNLTEWAHQSGIDAPRKLQHGGQVDVQVPPMLTLAQAGGAQVAVRYEFISERIPDEPTANPYELKICQQAWLVLVRRRGRQHYDSFDELLTHVRWFLGFAASAQDELIEIRGFTNLTTRTFGRRGRTPDSGALSRFCFPGKT